MMEIIYKGKKITLTPDEVWVLFYWVPGVSEDINSCGEFEENKELAAVSLENKFEELDRKASSHFVID